jgi:hypothetical protein
MQRGLCRKAYDRRILATPNSIRRPRPATVGLGTNNSIQARLPRRCRLAHHHRRRSNVGIINSLAIDVHGYPHINYYYDYVPGIRLMSLLIIGVEDTVIAPSGHSS